jgi:hypothetical protein
MFIIGPARYEVWTGDLPVGARLDLFNRMVDKNQGIS